MSEQGSTATDAFGAVTEAARRRPLRIALVLGSGMGRLAERLEVLETASYSVVPGLEATTVPGHKGCMSLGIWAGQCVLLFEGRLHAYEGHPWRTVVLPMHLARRLGCGILVTTNAAGGVRDDLGKGCLMAIADHLDWTRPFAWRYPGPGGLGTARPSPYSSRLLGIMRDAGRRLGLELPTGTYAQVTGPCYETTAEIRALRSLGADAVGMSTAREIQAGFDLGLECAGISCITNRAAGLDGGIIHHDEVLTTMAEQTDRLANLLETFLLEV